MGIQENKQIVQDYCDALNRGDIQAALDYLGEDFKYWVPGPGDKIPVCGHHDKAGITEMYAAIPTMFPKGFIVTTRAMTGEGDRVAVEADSYGETSAGKIYQQTYHYLFIVRDGKIRAQHEYLDTYHLKERMVDDFAGILVGKDAAEASS